MAPLVPYSALKWLKPQNNLTKRSTNDIVIFHLRSVVLRSLCDSRLWRESKNYYAQTPSVHTSNCRKATKSANFANDRPIDKFSFGFRNVMDLQNWHLLEEQILNFFLSFRSIGLERIYYLFWLDWKLLSKSIPSKCSVLELFLSRSLSLSISWIIIFRVAR